MRVYRRVTYEDRCQIQAFLQVNLRIEHIAINLGFHRSSVYRELERNRIEQRGYIAGRAHQQSVRRIRDCRRPRVIVGELEIFVINRLMEGWSPEQICGRLRCEGSIKLSPPTVYRFVRTHWAAFKTCLRWYNRRGGGRLRLRRYKRSIGLSIRSRPEAANRRSRRGDWERDSFFVAQRKQLLVCTDRKSRFTKIRKFAAFNSKAISNLTWQMIRSTGKKALTITNDNGTEFRDGPNMRIPVYFCYPHRPQQRGTVENTIGLIRHYIKRDAVFDSLTPQHIQEVETSLNLRPRKCLDYKTPYEVFFEKDVALAI